MAHSILTGDSPQAVAFKLLEVIAEQENKPLGNTTTKADKAWVLSTYKECLHTVLDIRRWGSFGSG